MKARNHILILAGMAGLALAASADGEVIEVVSSDASQTAFSSSVSTSDLLQGVTAAQFGNQWPGGSASGLNDGVHGGDNDGTNYVWIRAETTAGKTPSGATFTLGTGDNGLGYDITGITSFAAWDTWAAQSYTIEVQPVGGSFTTLATVFFDSFGAGTDSSSKVEITDTTGVLATGIEAIRFTHIAGAEPGLSTPQDGALYRELDVFGTSTVGSEASSPKLTITPNAGTPGNYDFSWTSQTGKVYDLVSATDLTTAPDTWPVYLGNENIASGGTSTSRSDIPGGGDPARFFAVVEKDP